MKSLDTIRAAIVHQGFLALDFGCGNMLHQTFELVYEGCSFDRVIGIDCFDQAISERQAFYKDHPNWSFVCSNMLEYPIEKCDLITVLHSLEHLEEHEARQFLNRAKQNTDQIIAETPNEFEDGEAEAQRSGNKWQHHKCLLEEGFFKELGFQQILSYAQNSLFSNSVYLWEAK